MRSIFCREQAKKLLSVCLLFIGVTFAASIVALAQDGDLDSQIGREVAIPHHLKDGDEFNLPLRRLLAYGLELFNAKFTIQEGAGRPLSKGTGAPLSDPSSPLV